MKFKRVIALVLVFIFSSTFAMPFFYASAANVFEVGSQYDYSLRASNIDTESSTTQPLGTTITVTPFSPTLLNFDVEQDLSGATIQFKNSSGTNFNGRITQNGSGSVTEGPSNISLNVTYTGSGTSQKISTITGSEIASGAGSITGLTFQGLPTSATLDFTNGTTLSSSYLYEEKFDVYVQFRNYSGDVYQFNTTPPRINVLFDVSHITGTLVGGEIEQIDGFGEIGLQRTYKSGNSTYISFTSSSDYIYSNRITLAPGQILQGHFVVTCFVLRTALTTAIPTVNSLTVTGCDTCRIYNGVIPSVLWNLYYINQKLDNLVTAPSNSAGLIHDSNSTMSGLSEQHSTEQSYFTQNQSNLEATGISNFQFDSNISSGLSGITSDFSDLWNALGEWKFIYTFTLLIGLATFLIRHRSALGGKRRSDKDD